MEVYNLPRFAIPAVTSGRMGTGVSLNLPLAVIAQPDMDAKGYCVSMKRTRKSSTPMVAVLSGVLASCSSHTLMASTFIAIFAI
ncbi:MAG: hypothetical protein M1288_00745 [Actinobacteria bacterium]|nr:hypothetical protein [Actinomycetota bacterium]